VIDVEEAAAEAFATAVELWPADGVPPNPGAWLTTTTANHKAIDRVSATVTGVQASISMKNRPLSLSRSP
jgi:predicted RNA polymerase sigma factor